MCSNEMWLQEEHGLRVQLNRLFLTTEERETVDDLQAPTNSPRAGDGFSPEVDSQHAGVGRRQREPGA